MMRLFSLNCVLAQKNVLHVLGLRKYGSKWVEPIGYVTGINVYNSLTRTKVPLTLRNPSYASWYICGPTVYDSAHIGHACCYVKFDIVRRILENFFDINVVLIMGVTDIDDKIMNKAAELQQDVKFVSSSYEKEFFSDMGNLNVMSPTVAVRVTDVIPDIILFIENILKKGLAYVADDRSVYFDTGKFSQYGKLYSVTENDDKNILYKKSPNDFALWKSTKPGEVFWPSPWGNGRPGWHIECSTIASNMLGPVIDLHSGGKDLIFPHHENEEAQSCAHHNVNQWVNYWLHSGHLHLRGDQKMSKSLKNTISIQEFLASNSSDHFRMFCLLSGYRNDVEYSDTSLNQAKAIYRKVESFLEDCDAYIKGSLRSGCVHESKLLESLARTKQSFLSSLADDFDTPKAIGILVNFISECNKMLHAATSPDQVARSPASIAAVSTFIRQIVCKLGIKLQTSEPVFQTDMNSAEILDMVVNFRSQVKKTALGNIKSKVEVKANTNLMKACDQLRDNLKSVGVEIKDHKDFASWHIRK